jgi:hypothetical protein
MLKKVYKILYIIMITFSGNKIKKNKMGEACGT